MKTENWTEIKNGSIDVPDCLMPLFNQVGTQLRFHKISGKNEIVTIAHIVEKARIFFKENPKALELNQ